MATTLQFIAYDTTSLSGLVGSARELYIDTSKSTVVVMDGVTPGGSPLVTETLLTSYCITSQFLSSQLTSYATLNFVTSELTSYATLNYVTSYLVSYVSNNSLTSTLASYTTNTNLTSTLTSYPTNANLTSTLSSALAPYATTSYLTSYVTNANLTSTLSSYVTNNSLSSQLTSYATLSYVNNLNNETDVIEPLTLAPGFVFYSGTSSTSLTVGTAFSSVSVISDSIIRITNPVGSTITSVTNLSIGSTLLVNYSSITHVAEVLNTPVFPTEETLLQVFFSTMTISPGMTFTLSSSATNGLTHNASITRAGIPQIIYLTEGSDFTVTGTTLTINIEVELAVGINITETNTSALDINYSSNTINSNFTFSELGVGYDTSSTTYNGSDPGFLTYTNPNGVQYFSDGRIEYPNNLVFDSGGTIVLPAGGQVLDNTGNTIGITINDVNDTVSSTLATYPFTTESIVFGDGFYLYNATSSATYNASTTSGGLYYDATVGFDEFSVFVAGYQSPTLINTLSSLASTSLISCDIDGYTFFYSLDDTRTTGSTEITHINAWVADELNLGQTSLVIIGPDVRYNNVVSQVVSGVTSTETRILYPVLNYRLIKNGSTIQSGNAGATVSFDVSNGDWYLLQSVTSGTSITISVGKDGKFGSPGFVVAQNFVNYNVSSFTIGYQTVQFITGATSITVVSGQTVEDPELKKFGDIRQSTATGSTLVIDFNFPTNYIYQDENVTNLTFLSLPPPGKSISTEVFIRQTTTGNTFNVSAGPLSGVTISITPNSNSNVSGLTDIFRFTAVNTTIGPVPPATTSIVVYGTGLYKGI